MIRRLWIAAGTTEGRMLTEKLAENDVDIFVTVATEYGASLITDAANVTVSDRRLNREEMAAFLDDVKPDLAIDATHPYATAVTETMRRACAAAGVPYKRLLRPAGEEGRCLRFSSVEAAVAWLDHTEGEIFLTTGSKDLHTFTLLHDFKRRLTVRILPVRDSLDKALGLGCPPARIIAMQGPFSFELNVSMFKNSKARWVVTKNSGSVGGFEEKLAAVEAAGAALIVIERPDDAGITYEEMVDFVKKQLEK